MVLVKYFDNISRCLLTAVTIFDNMKRMMTNSPTLVRLLSDLGLESKHARVYLACLELGEASVQEIAHKSGVKRTSLYYILERLIELGLIHHAHHEKKSRYIAEEPERLVKTFGDRLEALGQHIEELKRLKGHTARHSRILYYNSFEGFKQIWQAIFDSGVTEYLIITDPREMLQFVRKDYITRRIIAEKVRRGIKSKQLIMPSTYAEEITRKDRFENRESRILPYDYPVPFTTIVFGDNVALISPFEEDLIIIIESPAFAATERALFQALWQRLPRRIGRPRLPDVSR